MSALVTFRDYDPWFKPDDTGYNKCGYVADGETVIYPLRRKLVEAPLRKIRKRKHAMLGFASEFNTQQIESFFTENQRNQDLFFRGIRAICEGNIRFFDSPIRLPILPPLSRDEFDERWDSLITLLQPGDFICTVDTSSVISKLIAAVDRGTWGHIGVYVGEGNICEATTSGVVERPIQSYRFPQYRLGIYRPIQSSGRVVSFMRSQVGKPYNYSGVFLLGLMKVFGIPRKDLSPKNLSPNDLAIFGDVRLVFLI